MRVHESQAYRKMNVTRERINHILELSFQTGFSLVSVAVACAILESISGLEPSSVIAEPGCLKLVTVSNFCPFTLISVLMPLVLFVIGLVFSALISMLYVVEALSRRSAHFASYSSSPPGVGSCGRNLKSHLVRTLSLNVLPLKSGVGQYIAIHATLTARNFFRAYFYPSGPFTCIFSKTSPIFFLCWLWLTPDPV